MQTKRILGICTCKSYSAGIELCLSDSPSDAMCTHSAIGWALDSDQRGRSHGDNSTGDHGG